MARTGRPARKMPRLAQKVYIRADLVAKMDLMLTDPARQKLKYGEKSDYLEALIEADMRKRAEASAIAEGDCIRVQLTPEQVGPAIASRQLISLNSDLQATVTMSYAAERDLQAL